MKSLLALVVIVLIACSIANSGDPSSATGKPRARRARNGLMANQRISDLIIPMEFDPIARRSMNYRDPRYLSAYLTDGARFHYFKPKRDFGLLNEAIERIGRMNGNSQIIDKSESGLSMQTNLNPASGIRHPMGDNYPPKTSPSNTNNNMDPFPHKKQHPKYGKPYESTILEQRPFYGKDQKDINKFASTPMDEAFFTSTESVFTDTKITNIVTTHEGEDKKRSESPLQDFRQKLILAHDKTLVAEDLDKLRQGVAKHRMRIPVSLIPVNLNWFKINDAMNGNDSDNMGPTVNPKKFGGLDNLMSREAVYWVAVSAGIAATLVFSISLITYGFYVLVKRVKAAAAVDYPAYGVTGPTADPTEDRRLAQSAQMFHYQHQKQQIIAMERNATDLRSGSLSGLESEEENEEGDYTVYECPGFATTGEMEVKNPLYDEPTPATPGRVQVVQAQPKE